MTSKKLRIMVTQILYFFIVLLTGSTSRYKGRRDFVHQVGIGHGRRNAVDLVQRKRKNKGRWDFVHQVGAGHGRRNVRDLVQRERRYKGRRDFVHQVAPAPRPRRHARARRRPRAKKRTGLGAKETEEQGPAGFRAPSRPATSAPRPPIRKFINFRMIIKVY